MHVIQKEIVTGINIKDPIEASHDLEHYLKQLLADQYVNKCFRGMIVKSIDEILEHGDVVIDSFSSGANISVRFLMSGIEFKKDDIVFITAIKQGYESWFLGKLYDEQSREIMVAAFNIPKEFESIKEKQILPFRVESVRYQIKKPFALCNGSLYTGQTQYPHHIVQCDGIKLAELRSIAPEYKSVIDKVAKIPKKEIGYFAEITEDKKKVTGKHVPFVDLFNRKTDYDYVGRLLISSSGVYELGINYKPQESEIIYDNINPAEIIALITKIAYNYNRFLLECTQKYKDNFNDHENLFRTIIALNK